MTALLVACGALAHDLITARDRRGWDAEILALPALLHNRPERIPAAVERRVAQAGDGFDPVIVVYGDCGTGGVLDRLLKDHDWLGLAGPHCYAVFAGARQFDSMMSEQPGTFFLTDYLVGSFDHLVTEGLGLDRFPELRQQYFANYRRVVYLQQHRDPTLLTKAEAAAQALGLPLEVRYTGLARLEAEIERLLSSPERAPRLRTPTLADNPEVPAPTTAALEGTS